MKRNIAACSKEHYQILIVGGGITGACLAHDAALRGLSVMLVEKGDFGAYTSAASSKLLHGGIRYLPHGQVWKVRESYRESCIFQHLAPHATSWIPFLIPTETGAVMKGRAAMQTAMLLYRACAAGLPTLVTDRSKRPPPGIFLDKEAVLTEVPALAAIRRLSGAQVLWESHMYNAERMTLAFIKTAAANGARAANHARVEKLLVDDTGKRVWGAEVQDLLSGTRHRIQADLVINAAGPYVQQINDSIPQLRLEHSLTGFSKGVHLVTRQLHPAYALALSSAKKTDGLVSRGGRHFFIIPWRGRSLIGTTNVPFKGSLDAVQVTEEDIADFLKDINGAFPALQLGRHDLRYAFTGLYPLVAREIKSDTYQGTGAYQVIDHARNGVDGMMTVLGAKFTTARRLAEKGVDMAMAKLGRVDPGCTTARIPLKEGAIASYQHFLADCEERYGSILPKACIHALVRNHGAETHALVDEGKRRGRLHQLTPERETLQIEIDWAIEHEMALTLDDLVFCRTGLITIGHPGETVLRACAERMGAQLGWDEVEIQRQIAQVQQRFIFH